MAENLETMGNFSIQDTMEMGMGNQELLNDLFSPETSTSNPEDVEPIIKNADAPEAPEAPAVKKGKDIIPPKSVDGKTDEEKAEGQSMISDFLSDNEDEDEDLPPVAKPAKPAKPASSDDTDDEGDDDAPQGTQFTALANDLYKLGVFTSDDEDQEPVNTAEEFLERFNEEKKKGATELVQNFIGQFGEDYQEAFDAIFVKGVNPKEYFGTYNQVVNFAEMDLSDESNQVRIMKQALADQGFDHDDVESEIERLQNYGDLENVATKHHKVLVKKEASKLQQMEAKAEQEQLQKQAVKNQYINNVQTILQDKVKAKEFDGIPINPKLATELQDFLLVDKWKTPTGETLTDFDRAILDMKRPENHAMKVKVGLLLKMLEKDPTLSTIQRTGVTKKSNELFGEVARQVTKAKNSPASGSGAKSNSWFI
jgi:tRNA A58 N-methylase Trm61